MMVAEVAEIFRLSIMCVTTYFTAVRLLVKCVSVCMHTRVALPHYFLTSSGCTNGGFTIPTCFNFAKRDVCF